MKIPVLIEPLAGAGFRAKAGEPLALSADGVSRDEALHKLRELLTRELHNGKQLVSLELPSDENPWLAMAGIHDPKDPLVQEWKEAMAAYRQDVEDDPDAL